MSIDFTGDFIRSEYKNDKHPEKIELQGKVTIDGKSYLIKVHHRLGADKTADIQKIVEEELCKLSGDQLKHLTQKKIKADFVSEERAKDPGVRQVASKKEYTKIATWKEERGEPKEAVNTLFIRLFELKHPKKAGVSVEMAKEPSTEPLGEPAGESEAVKKLREDLTLYIQETTIAILQLHRTVEDLEKGQAEKERAVAELVASNAADASGALSQLKEEIEELKRELERLTRMREEARTPSPPSSPPDSDV